MSTKEQAEEAVHASHSNKHAALVIAVLAAALAVTEQQAKRSEVELTEKAVLAADTWNEYQAKSIRAAIALDLAGIADSMDEPTGVERAALRVRTLKQLAADVEHYNKDPKNGKEMLAEKARKYEEQRTNALERSHSLDNAAAALDLGIVLATASVITAATPLLIFSYVMGIVGVVIAVASIFAPGMVAF
jgi:hypothetical protein